MSFIILPGRPLIGGTTHPITKEVLAAKGDILEYIPNGTNQALDTDADANGNTLPAQANCAVLSIEGATFNIRFGAAASATDGIALAAGDLVVIPNRDYLTSLNLFCIAGAGEAKLVLGK